MSDRLYPIADAEMSIIDELGSGRCVVTQMAFVRVVGDRQVDGNDRQTQVAPRFHAF